MEGATSQELGRNVPPVGTGCPNGWDNNRFGRELCHLPQAKNLQMRLLSYAPNYFCYADFSFCDGICDASPFFCDDFESPTFCMPPPVRTNREPPCKNFTSNCVMQPSKTNRRFCSFSRLKSHLISSKFSSKLVLISS